MRLTLWFALLAAALPAHAAVIHVDADVAGPGDGTSWETAYGDLQAALLTAVAGDEVWVAEGVYYPTAGTDRSVSFALVDGVALYGGFAGNEILREERDWILNASVLSGDIGDPVAARRYERPLPPHSAPAAAFRDWFDLQRSRFDAAAALTGVADNSYTVVTASGVGASTVLDGFVITGGENDGPGLGGGGMRLTNSALTVRNSTLRLNRSWGYGGGAEVIGGAPRFEDCRFEDNSTTYVGGGLAVSDGAAPVLERTTLDGNFASISGGAIWGAAGSLTLTECAVVDNQADDATAGIASSGDVELCQVVMTGNYSYWGSGALTVTGDLLLQSALVVDNVTVVGEAAPFGAAGVDARAGALVTNSLFARNEVLYPYSPFSKYAGGLFAAGPLDLTNSTFYGNKGNFAGAVHRQGSGETVVASVIVWGNHGEGGADGLYASDPAAVETRSSLIEGCLGSGAGWNTAMGADLGGNLDLDPQFADPANGDFRLLLTSPAVNTGDGALIPRSIVEDLDGNPRFFGPGLDMGAFELQTPSINEAFVLVVGPQTLNQRSSGQKLTAELSAAWTVDASEIDLATLALEGVSAIAASLEPGTVTAKFPRAPIAGLLPVGMEVPVTVSGQLLDGTAFTACDTIHVIDPGRASPARVEPKYPVGATATVEWRTIHADHATRYDGYLSVDGGESWSRLFEGVRGTNSWSWIIGPEITGDAEVLIEARAPHGIYHCMTQRFVVEAGLPPQEPAESSSAEFRASPNPFNPQTTVTFALPSPARTELVLYDVAGRRIRTLVQAPLAAGPHQATWDGRDDHGRAVASGVYLCRLQAGRLQQTLRLVLLK